MLHPVPAIVTFVSCGRSQTLTMQVFQHRTASMGVMPRPPAAPLTTPHKLRHQNPSTSLCVAAKKNFGEKLGAELLDVVTGEHAECSCMASPNSSE